MSFRSGAALRWLVPLAMLLGMSLGGCERPAPEPPSPPTRPGGEAATSAAIPYPEIDQLEEQVQDQLRESRQRLDDVLASASASPKEKIAALGRAGMIYHAYQLEDPAEACYRRAGELAPEDFRWPYLRSRLLGRLGRFDEELRDLERARDLNPDYIATWLRLGQLHFNENRYQEASACYERARQIDRNCASAEIGLGRVAAANKDHAEAIARFERALALAPEADEVHYFLGLAYRGAGDRDKALFHLEKRGNKSAGTPDPLMDEVRQLTGGMRVQANRGSLYFQEGMFEEARREFEKAVLASPDEPLARTNLGSALTRLGRTEEAMKQYRHVLRLDPDNLVALFNVGTLLAKEGQDAEAVEHYEKVLRLNPDNLNAHFNLANALRRLGRFDEAVGHYAAVVSGDPGNVSARLGEALALVRLHRWREARQRLEAGRTAVPEAAPLRHALARVLAAAPEDDVRDGLRAYELAKGLVEEASSLDHVVAFAMAAAECGRFPVAIDFQEKAVAAVRREGRTDLLGPLLEDLELYRAGQPCRQPWREDDPALSPRPLGAAAPRG